MLSTTTKKLTAKKNDVKYVMGTRSSCDDDFKTVMTVKLGYKFTTHEFNDGKKDYIHLEDGVTGYESCDWKDILKWAKSFKVRMRELLGKKCTWYANFGTKPVFEKSTPPCEDLPFGEPGGYAAGWDRLEILASEIRRIAKSR